MENKSLNQQKIKDISSFYQDDGYIIKNPSFHKEDTPWKISKLLPLIDTYLKATNNHEINLLDVGGGAGLILKGISEYIMKKKIKVNKFALDLTPMMLKTQIRNNPDLLCALNQDITKTSFKEKEIDLTLMIDVLEHVPNPEKCLKELKRISEYVILKVPLEDNLSANILNFITKGKSRKNIIETMGHINAYNFSDLIKQIKGSGGKIIDYSFTNVFSYFRKSKYYKDKGKLKNKFLIKHYFITKYIFKLYCAMGCFFYKISPKLSSKLFNDFIILLVDYSNSSNTSKPHHEQ